MSRSHEVLDSDANLVSRAAGGEFILDKLMELAGLRALELPPTSWTSLGKFLCLAAA